MSPLDVNVLIPKIMRMCLFLLTCFDWYECRISLYSCSPLVETPLCLPNCWKRPLCHVFGTVSVSVFNDVYRLQVLSIIFCNQELFMEVRMSGPNNKFYHPGACRLIDAYFRLNLAWWVWFCRSYLQCLSLFWNCVHLFVRSVSLSWVSYILALSETVHICSFVLYL